MTKIEVIIILSVIIMLYLYIWIEKNFKIRKISIDEVANLSLREQQRLLRKEETKRMVLIYQYERAGYWKGIVHKYFVPELEKRIEIEEEIKIVEANIELLKNVIYENKF